jgi:hypothetical protein
LNARLLGLDKFQNLASVHIIEIACQEGTRWTLWVSLKKHDLVLQNCIPNGQVSQDMSNELVSWFISEG